MADSQVKTANICNITSSTELRGNGGGTGTFLTNNSIKVYCNGSAYWSGVFFTSGSESLITGDKYTISFTPYCTNNTIRVQFCGVADNYTFTSGIRKTITVTAVDAIRTVAFYAGDAVEKTIIIKDIQIEKGETATVYRPYSATGWVHSLRKLTTATEAVENPLYSDGTAITAYTIKGNTETSGTPSPSNPITISGVGNKTANLFNINGETDAKAATVTIINNAIKFENVPSGNTARITYSAQYAAGTYHVSCVASGSSYAVRIFSDSSFTGATYNSYYGGYYRDLSKTGFSISLTFDNDFKIGFISNAEGGSTFTISNIMLSTTEADYEPYGYKIPISSGGVTTNIYLSEPLYKIGDYADTIAADGTVTRVIKKLVFTGSEVWTKSSDYTYYTNINDYEHTRAVTSMSTHYLGQNNVAYGDPIGEGNCCFYYAEGANVFYLKNTTPYSTTQDFKAFLAAQYAAGTPVIVYYVLETPTTESVTAPSIPTIEGANTISVDTTVQPSEFTATWTGWHDSSVKEYDGTNWQ